MTYYTYLGTVYKFKEIDELLYTIKDQFLSQHGIKLYSADVYDYFEETEQYIIAVTFESDKELKPYIDDIYIQGIPTFDFDNDNEYCSCEFNLKD